MESKFFTCLECYSLNDSIWTLTRPLIYASEHLNEIITVPACFDTDLASVPRVPIIYMCWGARAHYEAVVHDYLYRINSVPDVSRVDADRVFLEAMKVRGKPRRIRWPMYCGVRLGGFAAYHKRRVIVF
jgi:hypothetical protein